MLEELQLAAGSVAERVWPSIVRLGGRRGGSGVVLAAGQVVTNAHNLWTGPVPLRFADGRSAEASVAGVDVDGDLAVLATSTGTVAALAFAEEAVGIGQPVFAVTATEGGPRVTFGLVSATGQAFRGPRGRRVTGSIEHTAAMAPGSSGSALVDTAGRLVGLNTSRMGGGFYRALPADEAFRERVDALAAGRSVERPRLGVTVAPSWAAARMRAAVGLTIRAGVLVREVEDDSAAARAGIMVGDLIVAVHDHAVGEPDDLAAAIESATDKLRIALVRGDREVGVTARLSGGAQPGGRRPTKRRA